MHPANYGFRDDAAFDDEFDGVASGMKIAVATLTHWLERYPERRRTHRIMMEPAVYTLRQLRPLYGTAAGRRRWLEPLMAADAPVLADTGRELLLAWDAHDAVLGLRAFSMGVQPMLALDMSVWSDRAIDVESVDLALREALARLQTLLA